MNSLYTYKLVKCLGWLLIGLSWSWSLPSQAKPSTGSLAMSIAPALGTYTVGQSLTITVTGGTPGTAYQAVLYDGTPATGMLLNNTSVTTSEAGQNTITWQAGQTSAYFVVRLGEGSQGAGRVLEVTNDNFTDYADSSPFAISPRSPLALTLSGSPAVGQTITATFTGGVEGEKYAILLYNDASYTTDLSGTITPTNGTDGTNVIVWQPGQTSASFDVRFEAGSEGSGRTLEVTNLDFTHFVDSSPLTIAPCALSVSIGASPATIIPSAGTATLTASGATSYVWSTSAITTSITTNLGGIYSVTGTTAGCSATASVTMTGADLSPILVLPQANFAAAGTTNNFLVSIYEVNGLPTTLGNVAIIVTAPVGYTISFDNSLTSMAVTGGETTTVNNPNWTVTSTLDSRQLFLKVNAGQAIAAGGTTSLGFSITRTSANSGSLANVNVAVQDDPTKAYDGSSANNVYARIISGL